MRSEDTPQVVLDEFDLPRIVDCSKVAGQFRPGKERASWGCLARRFDHRATELAGQHILALAGVEENRSRAFKGVSNGGGENGVVDGRVDLVVVGDGFAGDASPYASNVDNLGKVWFVGHAASMNPAQNQVKVALRVDVVVSFVEVLDVAIGGSVVGKVEHFKARLGNRASAAEEYRENRQGSAEHGIARRSVELSSSHERES